MQARLKMSTTQHCIANGVVTISKAVESTHDNDGGSDKPAYLIRMYSVSTSNLRVEVNRMQNVGMSRSVYRYLQPTQTLGV